MPDFPYRAVAVLKYKPPPGGPAFSFKQGDTITVLAAADDDGDWLEGELADGAGKGVFPSSFVKPIDDDEGAERAPAATGAEGAAQETVEATSKDDTNVVEGSEATPADVSIDKDAVASSPTPAPGDEDKAREPAQPPVEQPSLSDVTSATTAAPPAPADIPTQAARTTSPPPPPAKKSNALASRIAAFNAAATAQTPNAPPVPRAKPREWKRPAAPAAEVGAAPSAPLPAASPPPPPASSSPSAPLAPPPELARISSHDSAGSGAGTGGEHDFSAQDAADSISRGGGSLKDRIKALQGGGQPMRLDVPAAPGRAPKPWKKSSATSPGAEDEAPAADGASTEAKSLQDAVVKDERPGEEETTAQSPGAEVPGFEPAESTPAEGSIAGDDDQAARPDAGAAEASAQRAPQDTTNVDEGGEPTPASVSVAKDEVETVPAAEDQPGDESHLRAPEQPVEQPSLDDVTPAPPKGGIPIPALPKRAAGPRARKARSPAAETPPPAPAAAPTTEAEAEQPAEGDKKGDVLASMGGASALLAKDDDEDDDRAKAPGADDDDDFDTPAAPPPRSAPPPPPPAPVEPAQEQKSANDEELDQAEEPVQDVEPMAEKDDDPHIDDAEETDAPAAPTAAPPAPPARPPIPPPFVRQGTDTPISGLTPRSAPPPTRLLDPPAISSGAETVTDEPRPTAVSPPSDSAGGPPPIPKGRPPIPPPMSPPPEVPGSPKPDDHVQHPPIPTHPPAEGVSRVTTPAEDAIIAQMEDIVTPPEEAFDESTSAPEVNAETTGEIQAGRVEAGHEPAFMGLPKETRMEGVATPAMEPGNPLAAAPAVINAKLEAHAAQQRAESGEEGQEGAEEEDEEEEEEEEEDPEVARRRALAARMAKLGGRGMMPPMFGGFGGAAGGAPKPKPKKKKTSEVAEEGELRPRPQSQAVIPESGSDSPKDEHPPRRIGGMPEGGFALPGIAAPRLPPAPSDGGTQTPEEHNRSVEQSFSGQSLKERSDSASDKAFEIADADPHRHDELNRQRREEAEQKQREEAAEGDAHEGEEEQPEDEPAPPPLPPNRPPTMPPRRSIPVPPPAETEAEPEESEPQFTDEAQHVDEPESFHEEDEQDEMPPPPPPPRPAGGHQSSLPPSHPPPTSPPLRAPPSPNPSGEGAPLGRSVTQSSRRSSSFVPPVAGSAYSASPRQSMDLPFEPERMQGGNTAIDALARDIDLDTAGQPWWRVEGGLPRSLQGRSGIHVDVSENTSNKRGKTRTEKEIEVIYSDLSKTIISVSFAGDDLAEATTSISQAHFAPPPVKNNLDALLQWSASLGAQVFAAAHAKLSDKGARGLADRDLVDFCFGRATDPLPPVGATFGVKVYEATVEQGKKAPMVGEDDEPRAGDVVSIHAKFKHNLSTKTVGSDAGGPHVAIVAGWEAKKGKLKVIEVDGKSGAVDENTYRIDEMRAGRVVVWRVAPRDFV
ncbi:hypothetical protein Rhopal_005796-T1 [Rhodotorula paludigena]|uniref:SH3 domain-containing protein n=1 Tax=Rhodotorula paludigena TaxID=86838 RepID=A0AAV5GRC3_9BASI|nr:hypothetical protein Rhopal_005796-T1 [Rhodotorula paludigena]